MATTTWEHDDAAVPTEAHPGATAGDAGIRLHDMTMVRRFVSEALRDQGDPELSDDEWATLVQRQDRSASAQAVIANIILAAHGLRAPALAPPSSPVDPSAGLPRSAAPKPVDVGAVASGPASMLPIPAGFAVGLRVGLDVTGLPFPPQSGSGEGVGGLLPRSDQNAVAVTAWPLDSPAPPAVADPAAPPPLKRGRRGKGHSPGGAATAQAHPTARPAPIRTRRERLGERRRERLLVATSWVRNIGIIILLFVSWQVWGTAITQHHSQEALKHQFDSEVHHVVAKPQPGFTLVPATTRIPDPPQGTPMAHLQIPKIGLDEFVVSGTNEADLSKGPGHYLGTALPGQAGNVAIAGHRTTHGAPFNRLAELAIGDPIELTTSGGKQLTYIVSAVPVAVSPKDVTVLNNFGDNRLTLTTCNPEYSAVQRLIVVAAYLPPGAKQPAPMGRGSGTPYALAPAATVGWNTSLLPWVLLEVAVLVGLGLAFRRLSNAYGKGGRWLILGPIWVALLLALFETLVNFLPAAV
jgi:sortase A